MKVATAAKQVALVDCTLRDGSYQVGFGFTAAQTRELARRLEDAGIDWIEVGHGLGLGAAASGRVPSAASDQAYIEAAKNALRRARLGVFAMPAFATNDDLSRAVDLGVDFLRFGTDAARFSDAEPFVRHASNLGVKVTTFLMKTYTIDPRVFSENVRRIVDWGSDEIAIVDSAGGMTPSMVREYVDIARAKTGLPIVFHGHNNLELAVGNAIAAIEAGASALDASLTGLGRSAGNAKIEALAIALPRCGYAVTCDALALARLANEFINEISSHLNPRSSSQGDTEEAPGVAFVELLQGFAFVHSGMQPMIDRIAAEANVDAGSLTVAVGQIGHGLDVSENAVRKAAERLILNRRMAS
jgi:4-hydroxy-2-oxovalerate aldolase